MGAAWRVPAAAASPNLLGHLSGCKGTRQHYKPSLDPSQVFHPSFRVSHTSGPARPSARLGMLQVAQLHLGAAERLCKPGRPGGPSPAPPDGPSRLHLEAIRKSLSPCLTTSLGNAASTTRPSAAAQPRIPAVSAAVSLTYGHAGDATGKLASGLPGALAPSSSCEGKKESRHRPQQAMASLGKRLARLGCQESWKPAAAAPCPQSHGKSTLPLNPEPPTARLAHCPAPGHLLTELKELWIEDRKGKGKDPCHFVPKRT